MIVFGVLLSWSRRHRDETLRDLVMRCSLCLMGYTCSLLLLLSQRFPYRCSSLLVSALPHGSPSCLIPCPLTALHSIFTPDTPASIASCSFIPGKLIPAHPHQQATHSAQAARATAARQTAFGPRRPGPARRPGAGPDRSRARPSGSRGRPAAAPAAGAGAGGG
jgi:hypothetical protein